MTLREGLEKLRDEYKDGATNLMNAAATRIAYSKVSYSLTALLSTADSEQREAMTHVTQCEYYERAGRRTFCPEDGFNVRVDEDGCCEACGAVATGWAVDRLTRPAERREVADLRRKLEECQRKLTWDDGEWDARTGRMKIKECAKQIVDLMHERDDLRRQVKEAEDHERITHEELSAVLGTDTSLLDGARRMEAKLAALSPGISLANAALRTALVKCWNYIATGPHNPGQLEEAVVAGRDALAALPTDGIAEEVVKYMKHKPGCRLNRWDRWYDEPECSCTCGHDALLARLGGVK